MTVLRKLIGERIRAIRKQKGLTQEKLAEKADLMYQYIGAVERGTRNISIDSLDRILQALEVDYSEVFTISHMEQLQVSEAESNRDYIIAMHTQLLKSRTTEEINAVHRITTEIIKSFGS